MKIKELIKKLEKCNQESEILLLTEYEEGDSCFPIQLYTVYKSEPEIINNLKGTFYIVSDTGGNIVERNGSINDFIKDMISLNEDKENE